MKKLQFDNPIFRQGKNFTVRLGEKWKEQLHIGDFIEIEGWHGFAEIRCIHVCKLADIPEKILELEHDPFCRTWEGLVKILQKVYPTLNNIESEAIEETTVTCLGFWLYQFYGGHDGSENMPLEIHP